MDITFTTSELASLTQRALPGQTVEDVVHGLLVPLVQHDSEARLQSLADRYRQLTPEQQLQAVALLQQWVATL